FRLINPQGKISKRSTHSRFGGWTLLIRPRTGFALRRICILIRHKINVWSDACSKKFDELFNRLLCDAALKIQIRYQTNTVIVNDISTTEAITPVPLVYFRCWNFIRESEKQLEILEVVQQSYVVSIQLKVERADLVRRLFCKLESHA